MAPLASVVIPAHNEQASILATLARLSTGLEGEVLDVVVVCNGCTDRTAEVVRRTYPDVRVLEIDDQLVAAAGLPGVSSREPDSVLWSAGVRTVFGLPYRSERPLR